MFSTEPAMDRDSPDKLLLQIVDVKTRRISTLPDQRASGRLAGRPTVGKSLPSDSRSGSSCSTIWKHNSRRCLLT